jgi:hypothetical protein
MTRKIMLLGTIAAFGLAAAMVGTGDSYACDKATKSAAATSAGCTKDAQSASTTAASTKTAGCCAKDGAKATTAGNVHKSMIKSAVVAPGASPAINTAAFAAGVSGSTVTAGGASCCESKSAGAAASSGQACDGAKAIRAGTAGKSCDAVKTAGAAGSCEKNTALKTAAVDVVPYREDKRLVLTGSYECGHCGMGVTPECSPMFKTVDGKVYPLWNSNRVASLREDDDKNVEIATVVKKVDGVKYLDVKSYKAL